ncbi:hypothetical protein [Paenibacillus sp. MBLB4367]|uniref:hypothetical protein n=1 Tax=Paenibacillus sp. MBLB4367 TaxID=3384767 RepID=UPI003907F82D
MKDSNVISLVRRSIESSEGQLAAMKVMLEQVVAVGQETQHVKEEVTMMASEVKGVKDEIAQFEKEFRDTNRLLPSEVDDVYRAVVDKSVELAKRRNHEEDDGFTKVVGKYRRLIWSKLKKRFGTSKYIHIKRMDYVSTLMFIETFNPEDYL